MTPYQRRRRIINRETLREKLVAYLNRRLTLADLVSWAEEALMNDEIDERDTATLRDIVGRLGLADARSGQFGLTWEDCYDFLARLGYIVEVKVVAA
jgi:hypothetical protein